MVPVSMTYSEAIEFLYSLRWYGAKLGLENTFKLASLAGNPQERLRFIHVAGTNGKGSTCAMIESIYRHAGLKTGLFTSPHLVSFGERIQVNRETLSHAQVADLVRELQPLLREFDSPGHPTFFEAVTVMGLLHFARNQCDVVIWETGLGGRLDATNIVTPLVSVITNIQYDHQKWLGETLPSIAREKAGIIKTGVPVVTGTDAPEALAVISETARELQAPLTIVDESETKKPPLDSARLPLLGEHQLRNAAVALAACRRARGIPLTDTQLRVGLEQVSWPGRLQLVRLPSGRQLLLDGAHNPAGATALAAALKRYFPGTVPTLVLGILSDKDVFAMCDVLAPHAGRILLVPVHSERTAEPGMLAQVCKRTNPHASVTSFATLPEALKASSQDAFVIITGSLYLVGEAMEFLQLEGAGSGERLLNEWGSGLGFHARKPM